MLGYLPHGGHLTDLGGELPEVRPAAATGIDALLGSAMPVTDSIRWSPLGTGTQRAAYPPVFVAQHALRRIHERLASTQRGSGLGLLAGRMLTCTLSHAPYLLLDGVLPLPPLAGEGDLQRVLGEGLAMAQEAGVEVYGWYRSHPATDAALTPADVEAHDEVFRDDGRVVLVVAGGGTSGGLFRRSPSGAWPIEPLPFYELLSAAPEGLEARKSTVLTWRNYRASELVLRLQAVARGTTAPTGAGHEIFLPVDAEFDDDEPVQPPKRNWLHRARRPAAYGATLVLAAIALLGAYELLTPRSGNAVPGAVVGAVSTIATLDQRGDTLALSLEAFDVRARMFAARQMNCADLARGLVRVDADWVAYSAARRAAPVRLDADREARDLSLYQDVRGVEARFARTGCPRP